MNNGTDDKRFPESIARDMSSSAITSRLREASELHQLGVSLAKAKPMANAPQSPQEGAVATSKSFDAMLRHAIDLTTEPYDDDKALRAYIFLHFRHLMTPLERRTVEYTAPIVHAADHWKVRRLYDFLEKRDGHVPDEQVIAAFEISHAQRIEQAIDRLISNCLDHVLINRCPKCNRIVRTPAATQCLWCNHHWR
jgi:hypothetical protein